MLRTWDKRNRRQSVFHPRLESLEDRLAPAAFTVDTFADTIVNNLTTGQDSSGHVSLRSALQTANNRGGSNTISLPAGMYNLSLGELDIANNLTVIGAAAASTIINAGLRSRVFGIFSGFTVAINNVTMEQGAALGTAGDPGQGGAVFDSGALTLANDILSENFAFGRAGAAGTPGANGLNAISSSPATAGSPGGNGQTGGNAEGGAVYLNNVPGAGLSIVNCVVNNNAASQGAGGNGGQGGTGGSGNIAGFDLSEFSGAPGGAGGSAGRGGNALGGAVYNAGGSLVIQGSVFSDNFAGLDFFFIFPVVGGGTGGTGGLGGAGVGNGAGGVGGNGGSGGFAGDDDGGAVFNSAGTTTIVRSTFSGNSAIGERGGVGGTGGSAVPCDFPGFPDSGGAGGTGGSAGDSAGGAIDNIIGTMKIVDSSFFNNQAIANAGSAGGTGGAGAASTAGEGNGGNGGNGGTGGFGGAGFAGAIENFAATLTLSNSTVTLNSAGSGSGGAGGAGGAGGSGTFQNGMPGAAGGPGQPGHGGDGGVQSTLATTQVFDTIIAGDTAPVNPDVNGNFSSLGHNFIGDGTGSAGFGAAGDQVGNPNPMLSLVGGAGLPPAVLVPQVGSPVIDAGSNTNAPATDERGLPRVVDSDCSVDSDGAVIDIGAVEFQPTDLSVTGSGSPSAVNPGGTITYTITVRTSKGDDNPLNLSLTDSVPAQTTFVSFTAPGGWSVSAPPVGGTGTITATFLALPPSAKVTFTLKVAATSKPTASTITNTATIATTSPDCTPADNSATAKTTLNVGWLVVAADAGGEPEVKVFDPHTMQLRFDFLAFAPSFHGGVRVAVGDVNGDGIPDIIAAEGPGGEPLVHVYDGRTGQLLAGPLGSFLAFDPSFHGGLWIAAADINGDGFADIIVGEDAGGEPRIRIFSGQTGQLLDDFLAYAADFHGGVRLAASDLNKDGHADVIVGLGPGGPPLVQVFEGTDLGNGIIKPVLSFNAFDSTFAGGVYVAAGNIHNDGLPKIIVGEGAGGDALVSVFDGLTGAQLQSFEAFPHGFRGGVRVAAADVLDPEDTGDPSSDIIAAEGPGGLPRVRAFDGLSLDQIDQVFAFDANFRDGVFVAGGGHWG